ncbi:MAG: glycosyltransferase family 4 protein [Planctomycetota bacterium]|nr:MAG: glycosyltransferase family 4 protein [Planctomycetota bacterium]REJ93641.1 MAG: glycosyltransferase family 4 protein [Planctomycetota bacterium]REK25690.1 MAG: glycosyltransferase family 4 protein [Planctomycetota bacterium]REK46564.1 MAG: glycosyltransferase family 4 protein [Planctomycetota bacterium]
MHVLFVCSWYPHAENPVCGCFFQEQAEFLAAAGHEVGVFALDQPISGPPGMGSKLWSVAEAIQPVAFEVEGALRVGRSSLSYDRLDRRRFFRHLRLEAAKKSVENYIEQFGRPDVVHAQSLLNAGPYAAEISSATSIPWVFTEHFTGFLPGCAASQRYLATKLPGIRRAVISSSGGAAVGPDLADAVARTLGCPRPRIIPNAIDTKLFCEAPLDRERADEEFLIASVGSLRTKKNFGGLIHAFAEAFPKPDNCRLVIAGIGELEHSLREEIAKLELNDRVTLAGGLDRPEVARLFQDAQLIVSASHVETFGVTMIEAMACGTPVLATRSGGPEHFVEPHVGSLIDVGNHGQLVNGLRAMRSNIDQYDAAEIRAYAEQHYGPASLARNLRDFYCDALVERAQAV